MPIFRVKSVKIYTSQKKFTRVYSWLSWQIWGMVHRHLLAIPMILCQPDVGGFCNVDNLGPDDGFPQAVVDGI